MFSVLIGSLAEALLLLARMAPWILLGLVIAGAIRVLLPVDFAVRQFGANSIGSVLRAAAIGVPLPLCSCGVLPVAAALRKNGASPGATVSFLVTTPTSGVDSLLATGSLLGLPMAVARLLSSFFIGIAAGLATVAGTRRVQPVTAPVTTAMPRLRASQKLRGAIAFGFGELLEGIAGPLAIGCLLGGLMTFLVPPSFLERWMGGGWLSYVVMLAVGTPLYVCATGSIPMAAALLALGVSPGAAMVFLIAGPATNAAAIAVIGDLLGRRVVVIYLAVLSLGALATGAATDALFSAFPSLSVVTSHALHGHEHLSMMEIAGGVVLGALMLWHLQKTVVAGWLRRRQKTAPSTTRFSVPDMHCGQCATTICNALAGVDGVSGVAADPTAKTVTLTAADDTARAAARSAIKQAGYHPET
jgi:uncharacterized membrane protein YraQ (UPF0718 family)/copper chaperone CopZ